MFKSTHAHGRVWALALALVLWCGLPGCTKEAAEGLRLLVYLMLAVTFCTAGLVLLCELNLIFANARAAWGGRRAPPVLLAASWGLLAVHGWYALDVLRAEHPTPVGWTDWLLCLSLLLPTFAALTGTLSWLARSRIVNLGVSLLACGVFGGWIWIRLIPVPPVMVKVSGAPAALAQGGSRLCVLTTSGAVSCQEPTGWSRVPGITEATALAGLNDHVCALTQGQVACWRYDPPQLIEGITDAVEIVPGHDALWVRTGQGQLIRRGEPIADERRPDLSPLPADTQQYVGGSRFACVRGPTQGVRCQVFDEAIRGLAGPAVDMAANAKRVCAVRPHGEVVCSVPMDAWSLHHFPPERCERRGAAKDPGCGDAYLQAGVRDAARVTAGDRHLCALTRSGAVWCWIDAQEAEQIPLPGRAAHVQAARLSTCALLSDTRIFCWRTAREGGFTPPTEKLPPIAGFLEPASAR